MKLLIVSPDVQLMNLLLEGMPEISNTNMVNVKALKAGEHDLYWLNCGYGSFQLACALSSVLSTQRFHLVLYAGYGAANLKEITCGSVTNVINDHPGDFGVMRNETFVDFYENGHWNKNEFPHVRTALVNMSTAYFNVFIEYRKVAACTLNVLPENEKQLAIYSARYPFHIVSADGCAFQYGCLYHAVPFYQLRSIEKNLITQQTDSAAAQTALLTSLNDILAKL